MLTKLENVEKRYKWTLPWQNIVDDENTKITRRMNFA